MTLTCCGVSTFFDLCYRRETLLPNSTDVVFTRCQLLQIKTHLFKYLSKGWQNYVSWVDISRHSSVLFPVFDTCQTLPKACHCVTFYPPRTGAPLFFINVFPVLMTCLVCAAGVNIYDGRKKSQGPQKNIYYFFYIKKMWKYSLMYMWSHKFRAATSSQSAISCVSWIKTQQLTFIWMIMCQLVTVTLTA